MIIAIVAGCGAGWQEERKFENMADVAQEGMSEEQEARLAELNALFYDLDAWISDEEIEEWLELQELEAKEKEGSANSSPELEG